MSKYVLFVAIAVVILLFFGLGLTIKELTQKKSKKRKK